MTYVRESNIDFITEYADSCFPDSFFQKNVSINYNFNKLFNKIQTRHSPPPPPNKGICYFSVPFSETIYLIMWYHIFKTFKFKSYFFNKFKIKCVILFNIF